MQDSNLRPLAPKASAIPDYANSHFVIAPGLEPKLNVPKTFVLPLHHTTIWAGERNRTSVSYLEGRSNEPLYDTCFLFCWGRRTRTAELEREQIYSLPSLPLDYTPISALPLLVVNANHSPWPRRDSNSHVLRHQILSLACLPITPLGHFCADSELRYLDPEINSFVLCLWAKSAFVELARFELASSPHPKCGGVTGLPNNSVIFCSPTWNRTTNQILEGFCYIHLTIRPN